MSDKDKASYYLRQVQLQFTMDVIRVAEETLQELPVITIALDTITRDEAVEAIKKYFNEKMDALK